MAVDQVVQVWPATAGADLTSKQFTVVKYDTDGNIVSAGAGDAGFVLQDAPARGQSGSIALLGVTKAIAGGTIAAGRPLASDASGRVVAAVAGDDVVGTALVAGVSGDLVSLFTPAGAAIAASGS